MFFKLSIISFVNKVHKKDGIERMTAKKRFELSLIVGLVFSVLLSLCSFEARCNEVKRDVFRLHILAESDSEFDQALKLKVRDKVLSVTDGLFSAAEHKQQAIEKAERQLPEIINAAQQTVNENGGDCTVTAKVKKCSFNTREYDHFTLPAGVYDALEIKLGEGKGHNWWCVLFPKVCVSAASDISDGLEDNAAEMVTNPDEYKVRFKLLEIVEEVRKSLAPQFGGTR